MRRLAHLARDANRSRPHTFAGALLAADVSLRRWATPSLAWDLGPEIGVAGGQDTSGVRGYYLRDRAGLVLIGLFVRGVFAP